jgi:hypothetical protein
MTGKHNGHESSRAAARCHYIWDEAQRREARRNTCDDCGQSCTEWTVMADWNLRCDPCMFAHLARQARP